MGYYDVTPQELRDLLKEAAREAEFRAIDAALDADEAQRRAIEASLNAYEAQKAAAETNFSST